LFKYSSLKLNEIVLFLKNRIDEKLDLFIDIFSLHRKNNFTKVHKNLAIDTDSDTENNFIRPK